MADEMDDVFDSVKELFALAFVGFGLSTILYGISMLQTYLYYRNYPSDGRGLKFMVAVLFILDTLCTVFVSHTLYTYWVLNLGKDISVDLLTPWSFTAEKFSVILITLIAQCFYARMIWKTSGNVLITSVVGILAFVTFGLGFATTVHLFQDPIAATVSSRGFQILSGLVQGLAAFNDVLITVCLCTWLYQRKKAPGGWEVGDAFGTDNIIDTLILYAISRGILTAITQSIYLSLNLRYPDETYWMPWHQAVGKIFVNSVLAALNVRRTFSPKQDGSSAPNLAFADAQTESRDESRNGGNTGMGIGSGLAGGTNVSHGRLKSFVFSTSAASGPESVDLAGTGTPSTRLSGEKEAGARV